MLEQSILKNWKQKLSKNVENILGYHVDEEKNNVSRKTFLKFETHWFNEFSFSL